MDGQEFHDTHPNLKTESSYNMSNTAPETFEAQSIRVPLREDNPSQRDLVLSPQSTPIQFMPRINCPEKIVICIDLSPEMESTVLRAKAGMCFPSLVVVKKALKLFINNKLLVSHVDQRHQFALILLVEQALWVKDFTVDTDDLFKFLDELIVLQEHSESFDMSSLFDVLLDKAKPPAVDNSGKDHVPYIVRVVLIYGRSHCLPAYKTHESQKLIMGSPGFFLDILYLHEPPRDDNHCEKIFAELCTLDSNGFSYVLEASKTPTKVFDAFAKLVAHPLQRCLQTDSGYKLDPPTIRTADDG